MLGQQLVVIDRVHPWGEQGVRTSLEEVAKRVAEGGRHPKVRAWAVEQLERGRRIDGRRADNDRERAEILLGAVQRKLWVPDPVGTEFMVGAHLMACDKSTKEDICYLSGDCDDLAILLGSCLLSVGLYSLIIGHGYRPGVIEHVLCGVWVNKQWQYADPSTDLPLNRYVKFRRERVLSVPDVRVLCDRDVCLSDRRKWDPSTEDFVPEGRFVGVNGVPQTLAWISGPDRLGEAQSPLEVQAEQVKRSTNNCGYKNTLEERKRCFVESESNIVATLPWCTATPSVCRSIAARIFSAAWDAGEYLFGTNAEEEARLHAEQSAAWDTIAVAQKTRNAMQAQYSKVIDTLLLAVWGGKPPEWIRLPTDPSKGWQTSAITWREPTVKLLHDLGVPIQWVTPTGEPGRVVASGSSGPQFLGNWKAVDAYIGCSLEWFPHGKCSVANGIQNFNVWIPWERKAAQKFSAWVEEVAREGASALAGIAAVGGAAKLVEERTGGVVAPSWETSWGGYTTPTTRKKSSALPVLIVGGVVLGVGWYVLRS